MASRRQGGGKGRSRGAEGRPGTKLLVLHGNRQVGDLFLSRLSSLRRRLGRVDPPIELVAPDAPFLFEDGDADANDNNGGGEQLLRTWWHRHGNEYAGLEQSLDLVRQIWDEDGTYEGILGFSQGARLAQLVTLLHSASLLNEEVTDPLFPNLKYVIFASGYGDVPLPTNFPPTGSRWDEALSTSSKQSFSDLQINVPSLHIMGLADKLIPVVSSQALADMCVEPMVHEHPGGHHVPMQSRAVDIYQNFIEKARSKTLSDIFESKKQKEEIEQYKDPDEEHAQVQQDECESLALIFPEEFNILSQVLDDEDNAVVLSKEDLEAGLLSEGKRFVHPISYSIKLRPAEDQIIDPDLWPADKNTALHVSYAPEYPDVPPTLELEHSMNFLEFKSGQEQSCMAAIRSAAKAEEGMPCIMSCVYAAREWFESGGLKASLDFQATDSDDDDKACGQDASSCSDGPVLSSTSSALLAPVSRERIAECNRQGLEIAKLLLGHTQSDLEVLSSKLEKQGIATDSAGSGGKGGQWKYTIGLVGKPSAGKSSFFNCATAFARQRGADGTASADDESGLIGGATMAPHPFTTIDPNLGYCLVPAPLGSCPEDFIGADDKYCVGSTHGRDAQGRRLLPVMCKDVAGLVPGAYQGRGKGNKFLDDLTDADVLIHVVDASGTADAEGNAVGFADDDENDEHTKGKKKGAGSHPLDDLSWIRNELIEWVYSNLEAKWDSVARRGSSRLYGLFSGYRQSQAFVYDVLLAVERYLDEHEGRDHALDHLATWDAGDLHRLVSAFLGARFPMALALNKYDLPSATQNVQDVNKALPVHGAHVGTPLCAKEEMTFVRNSIAAALFPGGKPSKEKASPPMGVWNCLQSAIQLRAPILVFPVSDMTTYQPIQGMNEYASQHASLPNTGMIACLMNAGGQAPTLWDDEKRQYMVSNKKDQNSALRDVLVMKPGSTVDDVFLALKTIGAVGGDFVRAEGTGNIGENPKLIKKDDIMGRHNRIVKIMTSKRSNWQKNMSL